MRKAWLMLGVLGLAGCKGELFQAHADVAATAEGQQLSAERLGNLLASTKGLKVNAEAAEFLANVWIDYTLFAHELVVGDSLTDSARTAATMWPQIAEIESQRLFDSLLSHRAETFSAAAADSVYRAGDIRAVQHILYGVQPNAEPPARAAAKRKAEAALARLRQGADFGSIAMEESQDFQSARDSGWLPAGPKGRFVTAFDSAAYSLKPGETSDLVVTPYGFHIIRRPDMTAARPRMIQYLRQHMENQLDSLVRDSLTKADKVDVAGSAVKRIHAALEDPQGEGTSGRTLVSYRGGKFTVADFMRWVYAMPPQFVPQVKAAPDADLVKFLTILTQNELLLRAADSAGIRLTPEEWAGIRQQQRLMIDTLRTSLGLGGAITDTSVSSEERQKIAAMRLDSYFDSVVAGTARLRRVPPPLTALLRTKSDFRVNEAGVARAVQLAEADQAKRDSLQGGPRAPGGLQPAPGGAPIPGGAVPADTVRQGSAGAGSGGGAKPTKGKE